MKLPDLVFGHRFPCGTALSIRVKRKGGLPELFSRGTIPNGAEKEYLLFRDEMLRTLYDSITEAEKTALMLYLLQGEDK